MKYADYVAEGQSCGPFPVFLTLLATVLGASATLGVAAKAETIGFPAAWWLFSGALGLAAQGLLLSARIRSSGARTLPELARLSVGPGAQRLVAAVIVLAWPAVAAAQLLAFADLPGSPPRSSAVASPGGGRCRQGEARSKSADEHVPFAARFSCFATKRAEARAQEAKGARDFRALTSERWARNERRPRPERSAKHWQNAGNRSDGLCRRDGTGEREGNAETFRA